MNATAAIAAALGVVAPFALGGLLSATDAQAQSRGSPGLGPPLTREHMEDARAQVLRYWHVSRVRQLRNSEELIVVLLLRLTRLGGPTGRIEQLSPARTPEDDRWRIAVATARRALLRAAEAGFDLPDASHGRWRMLEVRFDPTRGVGMGSG